MSVDLSARDQVDILGIDLGDKWLMHYGRSKLDGAPGPGSGRFPLGSGENPNQHSGDLISRVEKMRKDGMSDTEIAKELGLRNSGRLHTELKIAKADRQHADAQAAIELQKQGYSNSAIAEILGYKGESSIRNLIKQEESGRRSVGQDTADAIKEILDRKHIVDVGEGVNAELGITQTTLDEAVARLQKDGYVLTEVKLQQAANPTQRTTYKLLVDEDALDTGELSLKKYIYEHPDEIGSVGEYTYGGDEEGFVKRQYPSSLDSSRIQVVYAENGGKEKDGVIEIRPGAEGLDLDGSNYAQVRILVDGTHYLKGMAMYADDLPPGVDVRFNTNKHEGTPTLGEKSETSVLKPVKKDANGNPVDPDNPFGAEFTAEGQHTYVGPDGKEHLSPVNKLKWEGQWDDMSRTLSSQFLAKQPESLIKQQLKLTYEAAEAEYQNILKLENPTLKKKMLQDFGDECDGATVHLKAAALPGQSMKVLLPVPELKDNECYCPALNNGDRVCLVRYPHAGTFEIPELIVNNKNPAAKKALGTAGDAIGINKNVAERLSGADFDGDTAMVIPTSDRVHIKTSAPLIKDFEPKEIYRYREGMKVMTKDMTQREMGIVSNLITDMTLKGASREELARAVKHSMVVIDAEKHKLDYTQSEKDQNIAGLKKKYQAHIDPDTGKEVYGASTLLSRRKQTTEVPERQGSGRINKETGEYEYKESGRKYYDKKGNLVDAKESVHTMYTVKDAREMSSGTRQEEAYAAYANQMKALANKARKESANMKGATYNSEAYKEYSAEVSSIKSKLNDAIKNAPRERRAQAIARSRIQAKVNANEEEFKDKKARKKLASQEIREARAEIGASGKRTRITLTDREWEAIQKGAIHDSTASKVFRYCDQDKLRERAMPKNNAVPTAKINRMKAMSSMGYTQAEIAKHLGVSASTVSKYIRE